MFETDRVPAEWVSNMVRATQYGRASSEIGRAHV